MKAKESKETQSKTMQCKTKQNEVDQAKPAHAVAICLGFDKLFRQVLALAS